jgi:predicted Zn-dependent protease
LFQKKLRVSMSRVKNMWFNNVSFLLLLILTGCSTVAVTGRRQLSLVNSSDIISLSSKQYQTVLSSSTLSTNLTQTDMIRRVGIRIQHAVESYLTSQGRNSDLADFKWEFNLITQDTTANAWCMPGGKVAFYTGIMPVCKDETGVAVVMGHEVAHAIANHGAERMSEQMLAQTGLSILSTSLGSSPRTSELLLMRAVGMGTELGLLKFSRKHESEADHMGLIFMAMAGYDPKEAPKFWDRMTKLSSGGSVPEFLSTHPSHETRISDLNAWLPEAEKFYTRR